MHRFFKWQLPQADSARRQRRLRVRHGPCGSLRGARGAAAAADAAQDPILLRHVRFEAGTSNEPERSVARAAARPVAAPPTLMFFSQSYEASSY